MNPIKPEELPKILALKYAQKFQMDYDDLKQEGELGLMEARANYKEEKGKFTTYAFTIIRKHIYKFVERNKRIIRLPADLFWKRGKRRRKFKDGVPIPIPDATAIQIEKKGVLMNIIEHIKGEENFSQKVEEEYYNKKKVEKLLKYVKTPQSKAMIQMYFGLETGVGLSAEVIGKSIGISRQAVDLRLKTALKQIREGYYAEYPQREPKTVIVKGS